VERGWGQMVGKKLGVQLTITEHEHERRLTARGNSFWRRRGSGWGTPRHQLNRETQSACRNGLLQRPWDRRRAWRRKGSCSCLRRGVNVQIEDRGLPRACEEAFRQQTGASGGLIWPGWESATGLALGGCGCGRKRKSGRRAEENAVRKDASDEKTNSWRGWVSGVRRRERDPGRSG